eukprot:1195354-Prorocentrum_minimum.AAC.3
MLGVAQEEPAAGSIDASKGEGGEGAREPAAAEDTQTEEAKAGEKGDTTGAPAAEAEAGSGECQLQTTRHQQSSKRRRALSKVLSSGSAK